MENWFVSFGCLLCHNINMKKDSEVKTMLKKWNILVHIDLERYMTYASNGETNGLAMKGCKITMIVSLIKEEDN